MRWRLRVPAPSLLVIAGVVVGLLPGVPAVMVTPDAVSLVVLPPLLFAVGEELPWLGFLGTGERHTVCACDMPGQGAEDGGMSEPDEQQVIVVGPDGRLVPAMAVPPGMVPGGNSNEQHALEVAEQVEQPAKVMRIGSMIKQLLEEVRAAPLDDASRNRLRDIHESSIHELEQGLAPELREELERLSLPFSEDSTPSDAELRIAQAQLVGWLEGLFHGIQTALFAQQMAARVQLEQMRRGLPAGAIPPGVHPPGTQPEPGPRGTGQYL